MELCHRGEIVFSAHVQRQTNGTASDMLSSCLKFKSLPSLKLFNKPITTNRLYEAQNSVQSKFKLTTGGFRFLKQDATPFALNLADSFRFFFIKLSTSVRTSLWGSRKCFTARIAPNNCKF